jgi:hypothetical protein
MLGMTDSQPGKRSPRLRQGSTDKLNQQPAPDMRAGSILAAEEYQALRAEIIARIQKQQDIMNFAILVITALLTYAGFARPSTVTLSHAVEILGAPASLALSVFALMTLDHEMNIAHATKYLYEDLRHAWIAAVNASDDVLLWNRVRSKWQQHPGWPRVVLPTTVAAAKYYAITGLNLLLIVSSWVEYAEHLSEYTDLSVALMGFATTLLVLTLIASVYTSRIWLSMEPM